MSSSSSRSFDYSSSSSDSDIDMDSIDPKEILNEYNHYYKILEKMELEARPILVKYKALLTIIFDKLKTKEENKNLDDYEKTLYTKINNCREKIKETMKCIKISEDALRHTNTDELKFLRKKYKKMARPPSPIGPEFAYIKSKARKEYGKTIKRRKLRQTRGSSKKVKKRKKRKKTKKAK
jgi:hypothetical protein